MNSVFKMCLLWVFEWSVLLSPLQASLTNGIIATNKDLLVIHTIVDILR